MQDDPAIVECTVCDDSGWRVVECAGRGVKLCGRPRIHAPHEFVKPCECRAMNRTYQQKKAQRAA